MRSQRLRLRITRRLMVDVPSALMVAPSAASLCCVAATSQRRRLQSWLSGAVMLAAMLVSVVPGTPGPVVLLAALCLFATMFPALKRPRDAVSASPMQIHQALSAMLMAVLLVLILATRTSRGPETRSIHRATVAADMPGMYMGPEPTSHLVVGGMIAIGAYLAFSTWVITRPGRCDRSQRVARRIEIALMSISVTAMITML